MIKKALTQIHSLTMYRAVLYSLITLVIVSFVFTLFGQFHFDISSFITSLAILIALGYLSSQIISTIFRTTPNLESHLITALILFFLYNPATTTTEYLTLIVAALIATLSKYLLAHNQAHIFNPVAIAAVFTPLLGLDGAIWWIASPVMLPVVLVLSNYLVFHLRRQTMALLFVLSYLVSYVIFQSVGLADIPNLVMEMMTSWPILFFLGFMLLEPLTMPHTRKLQYVFALGIGLLSGLQYNFGPLYSSPELALVLGNIFAYIVSQRYRLKLELVSTTELSPSIFQFDFKSSKLLSYLPGQYLEWTVPHHNPDNRGIRRYFTISSSPTEKLISLTIKLSTPSSSFKSTLASLKPGSQISVSHLGGDFILPRKPNTPIVMIAGGVGITPFRSMIKYLLDRHIQSDINLLYASSTSQDFVFGDLWQAAKSIGVKTQFFSKDTSTSLTPETIMSLPQYQQATYYISGPDAMVKFYKAMLNKLNITRIVTDYFPGF